VYTAMKLSSLHEIGVATGRRCSAFQPVFTRYKRREIERMHLPCAHPVPCVLSGSRARAGRLAWYGAVSPCGATLRAILWPAQACLPSGGRRTADRSPPPWGCGAASVEVASAGATRCPSVSRLAVGGTPPVPISDAKTQFARLRAQVVQGEDILMARAGKPLATLVPCRDNDRSRVSGSWHGRVRIAPDCDALPPTWPPSSRARPRHAPARSPCLPLGAGGRSGPASGDPGRKGGEAAAGVCQRRERLGHA